MSYPSWRYHKSGQSKIVKSKEEDQALGSDWADTPAAFDEPKKPAIVKKEEVPDSQLELSEPAPEVEPQPEVAEPQKPKKKKGIFK